jgi:hypothetical protein
MREAFIEKAFLLESAQRIALCNEILTGYQAHGLRLTLRQLYYQLVSRNAIPNVERSYKNLSALISDARLAGLIDWDVIEDRIRQPVVPTEFRDLHHLAEEAMASYRLPRWRGQSVYVEVWCEKDALAGVLWPIADEFHVTLMVNRGYSSQSAMYESAGRLNDTAPEQEIHILYVGDHDPSGEDMVRDITDRLARFRHPHIHIEKLALTRAQVDQYQLPPQPAKTEDARYNAYALEHGDDVWEVDALPPDALAGLVRSALDQLRDDRGYQAVLAQEERDKVALRKALARIRKAH